MLDDDGVRRCCLKVLAPSAGKPEMQLEPSSSPAHQYVFVIGVLATARIKGEEQGFPCSADCPGSPGESRAITHNSHMRLCRDS